MELNHVLPVVAYIGPGQLLPVASAVATAVGVVLLFGRVIVGFVRRTLRLPKKDAAEAVAQPGQEDA